MTDVREFAFFPYINLPKNIETITFDDVTLVNFDVAGKTYIKDEALYTQIGNILRTNTIRGIPKEGIGIVFKKSFESFENYDSIKTLRNVLFLSVLSKSNTIKRGANSGFWVHTSENFIFIVQNFIPRNDYMATSSGYIVNKLNGGLKVVSTMFDEPIYIPENKLNHINWDMFNALKDCHKKKRKLFNKIMIATELYFESYFNNDSFSMNARVLLAMSAFETLLDLPNRSQRAVFTDLIEAFTKNKRDTYRTFSYEKNGPRQRRTIQAMWANKFYSLRNKIIHGGKLKSSDYIFLNVHRHSDISFLMFVLVIQKILNKALNKKIFWNYLTWETYTPIDESYTGFVFNDGTLTKFLNEAF